MPRINISEVDLTQTTSDEQLYNVVYVPGFGTKEALPAHTPVLINSISDFNDLVGESAATFFVDESYTDMPGTFDTDAYSAASNLMFKAGDTDPSYYYAYNLISNGIPVVYERVNESLQGKTLLLYSATSSYDCFQYGYTAPTTSTAAQRGTNGIGHEYFIQVTEPTEGQGSDGPSFDIFILRSIDVVDETTTYTWEPMTKKIAFNVTYETQVQQEIEVTVPTQLQLFWVSAKEMYSYLMDNENGPFRMKEDNLLLDRNATQIKYLTTGGYPVFEFDNNSVVKQMQAVASPIGKITQDTPLIGRGDAIVLIDHTHYPERALTGPGSVFYDLNTEYKDINNTWSQMFTPGIYHGSQRMPGSFAFLMALSESVKTNPNWLAIAGVNRGVIPGATGLVTNYRMTRAIADSYMMNSKITTEGDERYELFINPITNIRPYGLTIWGNRTLADTVINTEKALYYANIRSLVCEIKKRCYAAAERYMFEQNSDVLWINFKSYVLPLLDQMSSSYGISGYKFIRETPDNSIQLKATIKIFPIYAVEDFDITVVLTKDDVEVEE